LLRTRKCIRPPSLSETAQRVKVLLQDDVEEALKQGAMRLLLERRE
jgi:hypothetical protein